MKAFSIDAHIDAAQIAQEVHEWDAVDDIIDFIKLIIREDDELRDALRDWITGKDE